MVKTMLIGAMLLAGWVAVWPALADETMQMDATGLHGSLIFGGAFVSGRGDRLAYNKKQPRIQSFSDKADNETDLVPVHSDLSRRSRSAISEAKVLHIDDALVDSGRPFRRYTATSVVGVFEFNPGCT